MISNKPLMNGSGREVQCELVDTLMKQVPDSLAHADDGKRWPDVLVGKKGWALRRKASAQRRQTWRLHASKLPLTVWFWAA